MTDEDKFLLWCSEHKLRPKHLKGGRGYWLKIESLVLEGGVCGVTLKINPEQDADKLNVYFDRSGEWTGGTNMVWNTGLPWES